MGTGLLTKTCALNLSKPFLIGQPTPPQIFGATTLSPTGPAPRIDPAGIRKDGPLISKKQREAVEDAFQTPALKLWRNGLNPEVFFEYQELVSKYLLGCPVGS